jgi:hypothetical protein
MHRRDFMLHSMGIAASVPLLRTARADTLPASPAALHVLVDTRFAASRNFGETAAARGAHVSHYDGDLTGLWQRTLQARWRTQRGAMAGIATGRGLLCLEQLAGAQRWHVGSRRAAGVDLVAWTLVPGVLS